MSERPRTGLVGYRIGGRVYPHSGSSTCKVCTSEHRGEIEHGLLRGMSYASIDRGLPPADRVTPKAIGHHIRAGHLPEEAKVRKDIIDHRAGELGKDLEHAEGVLGDHVTLARLIVQDVAERVATGDLRPDVKDATAASTFLLKVEEMARAEDRGDVDRQAVATAFGVFLSEARRVMDAEQWDRFNRALRDSPVLAALDSHTGTSVDVD